MAKDNPGKRSEVADVIAAIKKRAGERISRSNDAENQKGRKGQKERRIDFQIGGTNAELIAKAKLGRAERLRRPKDPLQRE